MDFTLLHADVAKIENSGRTISGNQSVYPAASGNLQALVRAKSGQNQDQVIPAL